MLFDNYSTLTAQASLDSLWLKTQVIANNLANSDTPNFKASSVSFEQVLGEKSRARKSSANPSNPGNLQNSTNYAQEGTLAAANQMQDLSTGAAATRFRSRVAQQDNTSVRVDGNNVQLEQQQTELWKTYAQYSYLLDRVGGHFNSINTAISNSRT